MITKPTNFVYDIFCNQVSSLNPDNITMELVNSFDRKNFGWQNDSLLASKVENNYENLNQRLMIVPVIHVSVGIDIL